MGAGKDQQLRIEHGPESPEEFFSKLKKDIHDNIVSRWSKGSKPMPIPKGKGKKGKKQSGAGVQDNDRLDRLESIMEQIAKSKAKHKPKAKVVKNTIVQMPPYPQAQAKAQPTPQVEQARRVLFQDLGF